MRARALLSLSLIFGCDCGARPAPGRPAPIGASPVVERIALPGAPEGGVYMDYVAYDAGHHRVWVPAGNTGSVDVIDTESRAVRRIGGFPTAEVPGSGRVVGPSSVTIGDGVVYVGSRADHRVCEIDEASLQVGPCVRLGSMPDGVQWVASTREVWVTTPREDAIAILSASDPNGLAAGEVLRFDGQPECYGVDEARGVFYTNLEDLDRTLQIDLRTHEIRARWEPECGEGGPKGLALDRAHGLVLVACDDHVVVLDAAHDGSIRARLPTGSGVDNIDYDESRREVYAAAAEAATLTIARLDAGSRAFVDVRVVATHEGARNAVGAGDGDVYVPDGRDGAVLVVTNRPTRPR